MRYKRYLVTPLFSVLMILLLVSCRQTGSHTAEKGQADIEKTSEVDMGSQTEKETKKAEDKASKAGKEDKEDKGKKPEGQKNGIPHILLKEEEIMYYDDEVEGSLYRMKNASLELKEDGKEFEPLKKAFAEYNREVDKKNSDMRETLEAFAREEKENRQSGFKAVQLTDEIDTYIMRADKRAVSVLNYEKSDYTGAKTIYTRSCANFDTETGKRLNFSEVVRDDKTFFELVDIIAHEDYKESDFSRPSEYAAKLKENGYKELVWTLSPIGVTVYFDTYVLGSYTDGPQVVTIPFENNEDIFEAKYVYKEKDYVVPVVAENMTLHLDVDGDGEEDSVYVDTVYTQDNDTLDIYESGLKVCVGESKSKEIPGYEGEAYLVKKSGKYYMYVFIEYEIRVLYNVNLANSEQEDDYELFYLSSEDNTWENEGNYEKYSLKKETFTDTNYFVGESLGYLLGTLSAKRVCFVGNDGKPQTNDKRAKVTTHVILRTLKTVKCSEVDEQGKAKKADAKIPAGSYILPLYTDNETYVDVILVDEESVDIWEGEYETYYSLTDDRLMDYEGDCYRITVDTGGEIFNSVDGVDIDDLFEGILFAG